jgi:hypothetical protein
MLPGKKRTLLEERSVAMLKTDLILRNPLSLISSRAQDILSPGAFGAVLARAGVGKTAFLIQVSLYFLLSEKNVLHVSLNDPIKKVNLWYQEVFRHIAHQYDVNQVHELWETLLPHRFIMTFRIGGFSAPKLEERLTDLTEQQIFTPQMIIIDGLPFDASVEATLKQLKSLARKNSLQFWFAIRTHRHEAPDPDGLPSQLKRVVDLFDLAIELQPKRDEIHIAVIKIGKDPATQLPLLLDPATMLIKKQAPTSPAS